MLETQQKELPKVPASRLQRVIDSVARVVLLIVDGDGKFSRSSTVTAPYWRGSTAAPAAVQSCSRCPWRDPAARRPLVAAPTGSLGGSKFVGNIRQSDGLCRIRMEGVEL